MKNFIRQQVLTAVFCLFALWGHAQSFSDYFTNQTLRIDYAFSGNVQAQHIAVDQLNVSPGWYGKTQRLTELPVEGYGQITLKDAATGTVIYRNSFSTLFQEWLTYDEAKTTNRTFENVFLVPMPKKPATVTIDLRNNRREIVVSFTHVVDPNDILIRRIGYARRTPYTVLQHAADTSRCIHIAFVAEGYTQQEMDTFLADCNTAMEELFKYTPFAENRNKFEVVAVKAASTDSGTSIPSQNIWKNTALSSHFDTFYSNRYLTTLHLKDLHNVLAGIPYEHIIVLVNTNHYGGGGIYNSYNLSMTHHPDFKPVVVHEFGHSFAGLADEYAYENEAIPAYPHDIEPWEANITTLKNFASKWQSLLPKNTPIPTPVKANSNQTGVYEGAGYSLKGVYRSHPDCRMRTNTFPTFCPVCQRAIQNLIDFYTR